MLANPFLNVVIVLLMVGSLAIARLRDDTDGKKDDVHRIASIGNDEKTTLTGKYRKVVIGSIDGISEVDCKDFEAEEIAIESIGGAAKVVLKLAKGKLKKLTVGKVEGSAQVDCGDLESDSVTIGAVKGAAQFRVQSTAGATFTDEITGSAAVEVQAKGNVQFAKPITGAARVRVQTRGDVLVQESIEGAGRLSVALCKDLFVAEPIKGGSTVEANYFGKAECTGEEGTTVRLTRVDAPK
jgi:hypothetical protein